MSPARRLSTPLIAHGSESGRAAASSSTRRGHGMQLISPKRHPAPAGMGAEATRSRAARLLSEGRMHAGRRDRSRREGQTEAARCGHEIGPGRLHWSHARKSLERRPRGALAQWEWLAGTRPPFYIRKPQRPALDRDGLKPDRRGADDEREKSTPSDRKRLGERKKKDAASTNLESSGRAAPGGGSSPGLVSVCHLQRFRFFRSKAHLAFRA